MFLPVKTPFYVITKIPLLTFTSSKSRCVVGRCKYLQRVVADYHNERARTIYRSN